MEQKIATPEELERLRQYIKDIVDKYALGWKALMSEYETEGGFSYNFDRLWRSSEGRGLFIKKHPNPETLTPQEKQEWEKNRIENIKAIGALMMELVEEYEQEYEVETDEIKKKRIIWVINAINEDYDFYFGHIIEPSKYSQNESKMNLKNIIKESINSVFEADYYDDVDDDAYRAARKRGFSELKKRKMIVLVGPPSVGKSTWIESNFPTAYIISRDDIVDKVASSYGWTYDDMFATPPADAQVGDSDEKFGNVVAAPSWMTWAKTIFDKVQEANGKVQQLMNSRVSGAHPSGQDVVVDMTNMNAGSRKSAMKAIEGNEDKYHKVAVDFKFKGAEDVIKKMAEKRAEAAQRMGKSKTIPPNVFDKMFSSYQEPVEAEGFDEIISVDNIENLKRALNDDGDNLSESIIKIVRESVNKQ
jgi:flagellar biosynthesis GTPase FlhF